MAGLQKPVARLRRRPPEEVDEQPGFYRGNADERPQHETDDHAQASKVEILRPPKDAVEILFDPDVTREPGDRVHHLLRGPALSTSQHSSALSGHSHDR